MGESAPTSEPAGKPAAPNPPELPARKCPFCGSPDGEVISLFGTQVMTMQVRCRACGSFYEASKY